MQGTNDGLYVHLQKMLILCVSCVENKPRYNPKVHHRRSIRLEGYDYSQAGAYAVTICCHNRECKFGAIENGEMILNQAGTIAYNEWCQLPQRFPNFELDVFQIMPNHIHAIVVLNDTLQTRPMPGSTLERDEGAVLVQKEVSDAGLSDVPQPKAIGLTSTVGDIVGAYKSLVAKGCLAAFRQKWEDAIDRRHMGKIWQRNYYEHIIRNEADYQTISGYIINNPLNWHLDKLYG